jgi:uncharacterized integral membrane protein (TIGR00698 family)
MKIQECIPGLIVVLVIAAVSSIIAALHASFDALVISIIIGMFFGNIIGEREYLAKGAEAGIKIFLPLGIALYGTRLTIMEFELSFFLSVIAVFCALFVLTLIIARTFDVERRVGILLASGLSVCGASAIAVISPLIGARKVDTSISVISVMMLGLTAMIIYPFLHDVLSLTSEQFSFFCGTTLPMLGQVKVASGSIGEQIMAEAVKLKLIRISFLIFLVSLSIMISGKEEKKFTIPWFIVVFIFLAVVVNVTDILAPFERTFKFLSSFFLTTALASIGFTVDFDAIIEQGVKPLAVIILSWSIIVISIFIILGLF